MTDQIKLPFRFRPDGCCQCGKTRHLDGSEVLWKCKICKRLVCRDHTLTIPGSIPLEYYEQTFCSTVCWDIAGKSDE